MRRTALLGMRIDTVTLLVAAQVAALGAPMLWRPVH
jgi:hypothetical protein